MSRADQTIKIKSMFVRREKEAVLIKVHPQSLARMIARHEGEMDAMTVQIETEAKEAAYHETT